MREASFRLHLDDVDVSAVGAVFRISPPTPRIHPHVHPVAVAAPSSLPCPCRIPGSKGYAKASWRGMGLQVGMFIIESWEYNMPTIGVEQGIGACAR